MVRRRRGDEEEKGIISYHEDVEKKIKESSFYLSCVVLCIKKTIQDKKITDNNCINEANMSGAKATNSQSRTTFQKSKDRPVKRRFPPISPHFPTQKNVAFHFGLLPPSPIPLKPHSSLRSSFSFLKGKCIKERGSERRGWGFVEEEEEEEEVGS